MYYCDTNAHTHTHTQRYIFGVIYLHNREGISDFKEVFSYFMKFWLPIHL
jgi:hypothetical protein